MKFKSVSKFQEKGEHRKKIVLYNSVAALLQRGGRYAGKDDGNFSNISGSDCIVVAFTSANWRYRQIYAPLIWEKYRKIVEEYKAEDWGIYDNTGELDRAIVASDAWSSLVHFQTDCKTGKPIMIVNKKEWSEADEKERDGKTESTR